MEKSKLLYLVLMVCVLFSGTQKSMAAEHSPWVIERLTSLQEQTRDSGALVVLVGIEPDQASGLIRNEGLFVQCLLSSRDTISAERKKAAENRVLGQLTIDSFNGSRLPYMNNLVNHLLVEDMDAYPALDVDEILRVLAPYGTATIGSRNLTGLKSKLRKSGATVIATSEDSLRIMKPYPENKDEWTHWLHSADNNVVSKDQVVAPARHIQWSQPPMYTTHHNLLPGLSALVTAHGKLFYIINEQPSGVRGPGSWKLIARDAFNGIQLWERPIEEWGWEYWSDREVGIIMRFRTPFQLPRRLVAVGEKVFCTMGIFAPVSMLDPATGEVLKTFAGTENTTEIMAHRGLLVLAVDRNLNKEGTSPDISIVVVDPESGKTVWQKEGYKGISPMRNELGKFADSLLTLSDDGVFFLSGSELICLDLKTGKQRWKQNRPTPPKTVKVHKRTGYFGPDLCTLLYQDGHVLLGQIFDRTSRLEKAVDLTVFNAKTGEKAWNAEGITYAHFTPPDIMVRNSKVWMLTQQDKSRYPEISEYDLKTGAVEKQLSRKGAHDRHTHHKCWRNKATENYYFSGKRMTEYFNFETGQVTRQFWNRGHCRIGIMPANGLVYFPSHNCGCYETASLKGIVALSPEAPPRIDEHADRLHRGAAYKTAFQKSSSTVGQWPTYRHDNRRSGQSDSSLSTSLKLKWERDLQGDLTPPIAANNQVFVADKSNHTVYGIDQSSGKIQWGFAAGGQIDSPPVYYQGRIVFGARDGYVYTLRADNGQLVWRYRAAPANLKTSSFGQIESVWPVHGSVLLENDKVYCAAGRNGNLNGGLTISVLDLATGKALQEHTLAADLSSPGEIGNVATTDIPVSDGKFFYLRDMRISLDDIRETKKLAPYHRNRPWSKVKEILTDSLYLKAYGGFLDTSWFPASYWSLGNEDGEVKNLITGNMLTWDKNTAYGVMSYRKLMLKSHLHKQFKPGEEPYRIFSRHINKQTSSSEGKSKEWEIEEPAFRPSSFISSGSYLLLAGAKNKVSPKDADPWMYYKGEKGGRFAVYSKTDGRKIEEIELTSPPVFDGMAVAGNMLLISAKNGRLLCYE